MEHTRNLLILHSPVCQDLADWKEVKAQIDSIAPDIEVRIGNNFLQDADLERWRSARLSLLFSPLSLQAYQPVGGTILAGKRLGKDVETSRLRAAGVSAPHFVMLSKFALLDPKIWGEFVIVKPVMRAKGRGIFLAKASTVGRLFGHLVDRNEPTMIQQFIDHTDDEGHPVEYRCLTILGRPLYLHRNRWPKPRGSLNTIAETASNDIASNTHGHVRVREMAHDDDVVAIAKAAAAAFPEIPVLGVDIVRERTSGRLYVLEVNSNGDTWHLSSNFGKNHIPNDLRLASYDQFGAIDTIAHALVEKTRTAAT